jgi:hypothetical protein
MYNCKLIYINKTKKLELLLKIKKLIFLIQFNLVYFDYKDSHFKFAFNFN